MNISNTQTEINAYTASAEAFGVRYENLTAVQAAKIDHIRAKAVLKTVPDVLRDKVRSNSWSECTIVFDGPKGGFKAPNSKLSPCNLDDRIEAERQAIIAAAKLKIETIASQAPNLVRNDGIFSVMNIDTSRNFDRMIREMTHPESKSEDVAVSQDGDDILPLAPGTELEVDLSDPSDTNPNAGPFVSTNAAILASINGLDWRSVRNGINKSGLERIDFEHRAKRGHLEYAVERAQRALAAFDRGDLDGEGDPEAIRNVRNRMRSSLS